jgi:hypothetical protein
MVASVTSPSSAAATPERILAVSTRIDGQIVAFGNEIASVDLQTRLLSINAQIEAARAGSTGAAFGVVASEMVELSRRTASIASRLRSETHEALTELTAISRRLATEVRGSRLANLALTNIDLIDRNLYERSCDVRWWATDAAVVAAVADPGNEAANYAGRRLGVILDAYTVYFDIVLLDLAGCVVANGRPERFRSQGGVHAEASWFRAALAHTSGNEFGFVGPFPTPLAGGERALVYSCRVAEGGEAHGPALGVLGVVFRWDALATTIVRNTPVDAADRPFTRAVIVDAAGRILADSANDAGDKLDLPDRERLFAETRGFREVSLGGTEHLVGHARAPGYEGYTTGWHSLVLQQAERRTAAQ